MHSVKLARHGHKQALQPFTAALATVRIIASLATGNLRWIIKAEL